MRELTPFLMFCGPQQGNAEEAMRLYCSVFVESEVLEIDLYGPDDGDAAGTVRSATFSLGGQKVRAIDGGSVHAFTFTPASSLWIECSSSDELDQAAQALSDGGEFLMPVDNYGFSERFCWVQDRFGVSWQLNLQG
ncbi:MAG TPA: VOC family protein [Acidimicrobiales bacterium]|nr:VOC family protein [Acidimicrobiales bacterium]